MRRLPKKWILDRINEGKPVQVACTHSNACHWYYLTTSGRVCREDYGYVEDAVDHPETIDLPRLTWSSCGRLRRALTNLHFS
jgi:hypothetical protein